jgi:2-polyprenyl-3-methyl-5-hydroxy-6-metoxy-1,4-benzoquinol methylase
VSRVDPERLREFSRRLFGHLNGAVTSALVYLGDELGLYRALAAGPATSAELAARAGLHERWVREWLYNQAAAGLLEVDASERFALSPEGAAVLADESHPAFGAGMFSQLPKTLGTAERLRDSFRSGIGLPYDAFGPEGARGIERGFAPWLRTFLVPAVIGRVPGLRERLARGARVADVGCGYGWSSIGLARSYPGVTVDGYDVDEPSVVAARRNATEAGVADRMTFSTADVGALTDDRAGTYDVVFAFECVHDMPDPVSVLAAMRRMVADDGVVVVMDERTEDAFRAPAPEVEQLLYGYSLMCCLGDGLSHQPSVGTGTVMRPDTFTEYARAAGFGGVDILPIEDDFFRFYLLHH